MSASRSICKGGEDCRRAPYEACRCRAGERSHLHQQLSIGVYPSSSQSRERLRAAGPSQVDRVRAGDGRSAAARRRSLDPAGGRSSRDGRTHAVRVRRQQRISRRGHSSWAARSGSTGAGYAYFAPPVRTRHLPKLFARALFGLARREHALESMAGTELWIDTPSAREDQRRVRRRSC